MRISLDALAVLDSIERHGSFAAAAEALHREHGMSVLTVQACYVAEELYGHSCGGLTHGGEIEALAANRRVVIRFINP